MVAQRKRVVAARPHIDKQDLAFRLNNLQPKNGLMHGVGEELADAIILITKNGLTDSSIRQLDSSMQNYVEKAAQHEFDRLESDMCGSHNDEIESAVKDAREELEGEYEGKITKLEGEVSELEEQVKELQAKVDTADA